MKYYVYIYLDPRKQGKYKYDEFEFEPFYVGEGKGNRMESHLKEVINNRIKSKNGNQLKYNKIRKILKGGDRPIIKKIRSFDDKKRSQNLEIRLIKIIGRLKSGNGILTNLTSGGEGTKEKIRNSNLGKTHNISEEGRRKMSKAQKGKTWKMSEEAKNKIGKSKKGKKLPNLVKEKMSKSHTKYNIEQYTKKDIFIKLWDSSKQVEEKLGFKKNSINVACSRGFFHKGFIWKYRKIKNGI